MQLRVCVESLKPLTAALTLHLSSTLFYVFCSLLFSCCSPLCSSLAALLSALLSAQLSNPMLHRNAGRPRELIARWPSRCVCVCVYLCVCVRACVHAVAYTSASVGSLIHPTALTLHLSFMLSSQLPSCCLPSSALKLSSPFFLGDLGIQRCQGVQLHGRPHAPGVVRGLP
jgi:hypothetical protein